MEFNSCTEIFEAPKISVYVLACSVKYLASSQVQAFSVQHGVTPFILRYDSRCVVNLL